MCTPSRHVNEPIEGMKPMGRAWPILILLGFCQLCASWGSLAIIAVQVEMRSGLGITAEEVAALVWAFSFSLAVGALVAQVLIGHWERRAVLFASLHIFTVGGGIDTLRHAARDHEWQLALISLSLVSSHLLFNNAISVMSGTATAYTYSWIPLVMPFAALCFEREPNGEVLNYRSGVLTGLLIVMVGTSLSVSRHGATTSGIGLACAIGRQPRYGRAVQFDGAGILALQAEHRAGQGGFAAARLAR